MNTKEEQAQSHVHANVTARCVWMDGEASNLIESQYFHFHICSFAWTGKMQKQNNETESYISLTQ